jgi:hypothetical protein
MVLVVIRCGEHCLILEEIRRRDRLNVVNKLLNTSCEIGYTVRKIDLILRPIERRPQMQFSMASRFKLQLLRRYSVKFSKMRNFTLGTP